MGETDRKQYRERLEARHRRLDGFGEAHTASEWARRLGLPRNTLWRYLKGGLTVEEAAQLRGIKYP